MHKTSFSSLMLAACLLLIACPGPPDGGDGGSAEDPRRAWLTELPEASAPAPGSPVWAAVPREDGSVEVGAFEVVAGDLAAGDGGLALVDSLGRRFEDVPPALVAPRSSEAPDAGSLVLASMPEGGLVVARAAAEGAIETSRAGAALRQAASAAEVLGEASELTPFRPAAYRDEVGWQRALVLALDSESAWLLAPDGRVVAKPRGEVHALEIRADHAVGDAVLVHAWATGYRPGTIQEILEDGLLVGVEVDGERRVVGFESVLAQPAPWGG